jgi:tyrosyl-tRNA synthetase
MAEAPIVPIGSNTGSIEHDEVKAANIIGLPPTPRINDEEQKARLDMVLSISEECIHPEELLALIANKPNPVAYDGFEPSGRMHLAQGLMRAHNVNLLTNAGFKFKFWVADWFALMNNKMGGDIKKIQIIGRYMIEVWKACGMNMTNVEFLWSSEEIAKRPNEYFMRVIDIASKNSVTRITRCSQIMGRTDENLSAAQIMYPCMQCADIFFLGADICQMGMDQRKVNVLAREYCDQIGRKFKPIILSHHMIMGLGGQEKASKSDPSSAIFMEDSVEEVNHKIRQSWCPPPAEGAIQNPMFDYIEHIILKLQPEFEVTRKFSNERTKYTGIQKLRDDYIDGYIHPDDLKTSVALAINALLNPVRRRLIANPTAQILGKQVREIMLARAKIDAAITAAKRMVETNQSRTPSSAESVGDENDESVEDKNDESVEDKNDELEITTSFMQFMIGCLLFILFGIALFMNQVRV